MEEGKDVENSKDSKQLGNRQSFFVVIDNLESNNDPVEVTEGKAKIQIQGGHHSPEKTIGYYHKRMSFLRDYLIVCLSALSNPDANLSTVKTWRILDAFASSGILSIRMIKEIEHITVRNDFSNIYLNTV